MNERALDFDLIMALAAGEIPPEKAAELEAELDGAARRELASQRAALQALGGLEQPALSAWERRRLRAGVRAELGTAAAPRARRRYRRRKVRWTRALPALAAAAAVVAAVGVARNNGLRLLESDRDVQATTSAPAETTTYMTAAPPAPALTLTTTAAAMPATTTTAAPAAEAAVMEAEAAAAFAETEAATTEASEAMQDEAARAAADAAQAAEETAEQMEQEDGDAAAAGAGGAGGPESAPSASPVSFDLSSEELIELAGGAELPAGFLDESAGGAAPFPASELGARAGRAGLACWEGVEAAEEGRVLFMGAGLIDGSEGEAYFVEEDGAAEVHLFNSSDCTNLNP